EQFTSEWAQIRQFMSGYVINLRSLLQGLLHDIEAMDNALDTLLGVSHQFLRTANEFQHTLELARPLRIGRTIRQEYDVVMLLAYRVQALSPGIFTQRFLEAYNEDDAFFFYDHADRRFMGGESLADTVARHIASGRTHLARALQSTTLSRA
ncbi:MAG: hypothetical protein AAB834_00195, partial [Patescibacteria group bacterium]